MDESGTVLETDSPTIFSEIGEIQESTNSNPTNIVMCNTKTGTSSEDFIIVENPGFSQQLNPVYGGIAMGVENDILPPPRTLDDVPRRRGGRRKGVTNAAKAKKQKRLKTAEENTDVYKNEISSTDDDSLLQSQSHSSEITQILNQDVTIVEVKRSASYGLRRKFQSKDFSYDNDFIFHESEEEVLPKSYICSQCQAYFQTRRDLQQHQLTAHEHYKCDLCGSDFITMLGLKKHVQLKHSQSEQDKTYLCLECDFICESEMELKQHQFFMHSKNKEHICDMCGKDYTTLLGLQKHISLQHSETECSLCNQTFKLGQALIDHIKICGGESTASDFLEAKVQKPKIFPCKICGKKFSERGNRARHIKIHQGILQFTCSHCGKKCSEKQALLSHIRHIHTGERPHHCNMCPRSFVTMSDLRRHKLTVHTELRRFSCSDCGKAFKTREALKNHLKHKSGEKLWQCGVCSKKFVTKGSLKAHMVVHSGIKMYECETCQRQFTHKGSLEAHVRVHTGLMPYVCPKCGKKFAHLQNRNRHVRTMHGDSVEEP